MHQHDPDLIMALAEGTLPDGEAAAARHEISACDTCSADLDAQLVALEALRAAPAVTLTAAERSELRSALRTELRLDTPAAAVAAPPKRRRWAPAWALGGAAAVLIAVLAVAPALQRLPGGDDDAAAQDEVALASTTVAAETTAPALVAPLPEAGGLERSESDATDALSGDAAFEAETTTVSPTTTTAAPLPEVALTDIADLRLGEYFDFVTRTQGNLPLATQLYASSASSTGPAPGTVCEPPPELQISPDAEVAAVALARIETGELAPVFAYRNPDADTPILVVYDPATCAVLETVTPQP